MSDDGTIRTFPGGATRDTAEGKTEYGGFLSPLVLRRFGEYMNGHRTQSDGTLRDADNWQKGIPTPVYLESLLRHVMDIWLHVRGFGGEAIEEDYQEVLCAALFNIQGMLHTDLTSEVGRPPWPEDAGPVPDGTFIPDVSGPIPKEHPNVGPGPGTEYDLNEGGKPGI